MALKKELNQRILDGLVQSDMGMGTYRDKIKKITPEFEKIDPVQAQNWYASDGFIQNIIDAPAEDSIREWFTIDTNREDIQLSRLIQNRLTELDFAKKLTELIRYIRLFNMGGILYYDIDSKIPQTPNELAKPLRELNKIESIKVFSPKNIQFQFDVNPLSKNYDNPKIRIGNAEVHSSRYKWICNGFLPDLQTGISALQTILPAIIAASTTLWSLTNALSELSIKTFKSPQVDTDETKLVELISLIRHCTSTQSVFAHGVDESLERLNINLGGIDKALDYIMDTLSGLSKIPKSRLFGQAQGSITGGQYDLKTYYDNIAKFQEIELRPIIDKTIELTLKETSGQIYKEVGNTNIDWEVKFNPLYKLNEIEQSDVNLKQAQTDQIYINLAVVSPDEVRQKRFNELEEFSNIKTENLNFETKDELSESSTYPK